MVIYAVATLLLGYIARKFQKTRKFLDGTAKIIIDNGHLNKENLKKAKLDLNEFLVMCREQGYFDLNSIHTALFEYNGKLSILPTSSRRPATPNDFKLTPTQETLFTEIIMDGRLLEKNLQSLGFDLKWLFKQMKSQKIGSFEDVFLAICDKNQNITFYKK